MTREEKLEAVVRAADAMLLQCPADEDTTMAYWRAVLAFREAREALDASTDSVSTEPKPVHEPCKGTGYVHLGDRNTGSSYRCDEWGQPCPVLAAAEQQTKKPRWIPYADVLECSTCGKVPSTCKCPDNDLYPRTETARPLAFGDRAQHEGEACVVIRVEDDDGSPVYTVAFEDGHVRGGVASLTGSGDRHG